MALSVDYTADLHMHTTYSDGSAGVRDVIEAAIGKGLKRIAITDHMPLPFPDRYDMDPDAVSRYRDEIEQTREAYSDRIDVLVGLEMEYLPGYESWTEKLLESGWEYTIGSVHYMVAAGRRGIVNGTPCEFRQLLHGAFGGSIRALCTHYYQHLRALIDSGLFKTVGHLDVVKKHNENGFFFNEEESWYRELVLEALEHVTRSGIQVEINVSGFNHPPKIPYPGPWILQECGQRNIPLVVSSDAHRPNCIGAGFQKLKRLLKDA